MKKIIFVSLILCSIILFWCNNTNNNPEKPEEVAQVWEDGLIDGEVMIDWEIYAGEKIQQKILDEQFKGVDEKYALLREIEDLEDLKKSGLKAKRSCNAIADASTCIEYYGSFWTEEMVRIGCDEWWVFSSEACPRDMAGWCNTAVGTNADMVAWMYTYGGWEMNTESIKYAKMACDATMASKWIN